MVSMEISVLQLPLGSTLHITGPGVELERPLSVQSAQGPELQRHGVRAGAGRVLVFQSVVVVVLDRLPVRVQGEGPEAVQMDLFAESGCQGVHEEAGGRTLDVHVVGQPVASDSVEKA